MGVSLSLFADVRPCADNNVGDPNTNQTVSATESTGYSYLLTLSLLRQRTPVERAFERSALPCFACLRSLDSPSAAVLSCEKLTRTIEQRHQKISIDTDRESDATRCSM